MIKMKVLLLTSWMLLGTNCKNSDESLNVNLTENNCTRGGSFSSKEEMCAFLKKEMEGSCVHRLAKQSYQSDCVGQK